MVTLSVVRAGLFSAGGFFVVSVGITREVRTLDADDDVDETLSTRRPAIVPSPVSGAFSRPVVR